MNKKSHHPLILAPAGNRASFMAAIAAGADAIYCGLKQHSARMEAKNFSIEELSILAPFAHEKGILLYIAMNSLIRPDDLLAAGRAIDLLNRHVHPDALIIQDLSLISMARKAGFQKEIHLSTLANAGFPEALKMIRKIEGVDCVVIPRELDIDEIKQMAAACPDRLSLEIFIHGALCYGVSGRCYWSSFFGGKSGLRGRCVQPCRRFYSQGEKREKFFSCLDLGLDVLVRTLEKTNKIRTWKIEGRKKGPHYVYYTVTAYKMLRDEGSDPKIKKSALQMLELALGREKTHYNFLPQRQYNPIPDDTKSASGRLIATVKGSRKKPYIEPREPLFAEDVLRIGNEDIAGHEILRLKKSVPGRGRFYLNLSKKKFSVSDTPVFLCDRREPALSKMIRDLENRLPAMPERALSSSFTPGFSKSRKQKGVKTFDVLVSRHYKRPSKGKAGLWICEDSVNKIPKKGVSDTWWWLPPVIWPKDEETFTKLVKIIISKGGRTFVCNAPWQTCFFEGRRNFELWAGPFCNIANGLAADMLASFGFTGAIVSPELARDDFLNLPKQISSSLSLGIVLSGIWPLCISRTVSNRLDCGKPFSSPKKEDAWAVSHEENTWVFPNWRLDLESEKKRLQNAGYSIFIHMNEDIPNSVHMKKRPGMWNWDLKLL